ncbi:DUF6541 family protein [Georgenia faecalis]|uniref:DUF6541 family protein n=1 Tax=Georgenia faecalis TaxID=2483799 RepID=A0ABV9DD49_9MICO|nr:DUF6541 family protein [Georgenia faecalis]
MQPWLTILVPGLVGLLLLLVPGLAVGRVLRLRGLLWWGTAPLLSGGIIGTTAVAAPALGLAWGVGTVALGTAAGVVLALIVRLLTLGVPRRTEGTPEQRRRAGLAAVGGLLVAAAVQAGRIVAALDGPGVISQTFDANYHLNAVQLILDRADASSLHMTLSTPDKVTSFYPALWHGLVALIEQVTGVGVPEATTTLTLLVAAVVWPLSVLAMARVMFGPHALLLGSAAALATAFTQFPELLSFYGVLYPNLLAYAVLPAFLALVLRALVRRPSRAWIADVALLVVGAVALTLAQTNALFAAAFILLPAVAVALWQRSRTWLARTSVPAGQARAWVGLVWALTASLAVLAYVASGRIQTVQGLRTSPVYWPVDDSVLGATWKAIILSAGSELAKPQWVLALLVAVGVVAAVRMPRHYWLVAAHAVVIALYVVSTSVEGPLRSQLTGYWYGDDIRLAALLPVTGVPLAALGVAQLVRWLSAVPGWVARRRSADVAVRHGRPSAGRRDLPAAAVLVVVAALAVGQGFLPAGQQSFDELARGYHVDPTSTGSIGLLSANEMELLSELDEIVPEGVVVAGNPWDGSAMSWAVGDRQALFPHISIIWTEETGTIAVRLNEANTDPRVCEAVEDLNVGYVLDMGRPMWGGDPNGGHLAYPGLEGLVDAGVAEPVASVGPARLLEITACD